eukprot:906485-Pyramimonas_sp.AAC.1
MSIVTSTCVHVGVGRPGLVGNDLGARRGAKSLSRKRAAVGERRRWPGCGSDVLFGVSSVYRSIRASSVARAASERRGCSPECAHGVPFIPEWAPLDPPALRDSGVSLGR